VTITTLFLWALQLNVEGLSAAKTKFEGKVTILHHAEKDAINWLNSVATTALAK